MDPGPSEPQSSRTRDTSSAGLVTSAAPYGWGSCHNTHHQIMA